MKESYPMPTETELGSSPQVASKNSGNFLLSKLSRREKLSDSEINSAPNRSRRLFSRLPKLPIEAVSDSEGSQAPETSKLESTPEVEVLIDHNEGLSRLEAKETVPAKSSAKNNLEIPTEVMEEQPQPTEILQQVAEAAKNNEAVEIKYEKQHESKDEAGSTAFGATKVGAILSRMKQDDSSMLSASALPSVERPAETEGPKDDTPSIPNAYLWAIRRGFWSGIGVVGLTALIVIMRAILT